MAQNKPAHEFKLGRIRATIWPNENGHDGIRSNVMVSRMYKDAGDWKDSSSLSRDDLPVLCKALEMAYSWIWDRQATASEDETL